MSKLERLKKTKNLSDLAKLLGFTPKGLSYVIYQIPDTKKYKVFDIPKKTGGIRTIKAPVDQLSLLQSRLAELLTECVEELIKEPNDCFKCRCAPEKALCIQCRPCRFFWDYKLWSRPGLLHQG